METKVKKLSHRCGKERKDNKKGGDAGDIASIRGVQIPPPALVSHTQRAIHDLNYHAGTNEPT